MQRLAPAYAGGNQMSQLDPKKLSVTFMEGTDPYRFQIPRVYTLTHSDFSGNLFLTIGQRLNKKQISGLYTRFMRDEVWAEWVEKDGFSLLVHCHVSGGFILGNASWRSAILQEHMPLVLQSFRYGERLIFDLQPELDDAKIQVYFHSRKKNFDKLVFWGLFRQFHL
jgi:hypothetical protein